MFRSNKPRHSDAASAFLKKCPLCGVLNTLSTDSCACCGWQGRFLRDPNEVRQALLDLYSEHPVQQADEIDGNSFLLKWLRRISEA